MLEEVADHLRQLEASGVIRPSKSPFSSPVVCCRKKDGRLRLCVDYRLLNIRTKKDNYCLPRIEEILDSLKGAALFSRLDLKSGYHQIEIAEEDKERTAFTVGPLGFYEHNRLAFGLCNSPATFQRVMEDCFDDINLKDMFVYIDDIIVFSRTVEEHLEKLRKVFCRLRDCGLKLAPQKCELLQREISFLGYQVSEAGIHTDPEKVQKVRQWKTPRNNKELASFLGFASYYRRFVKDFSKLALPLTTLKNDLAKKWRWTGPNEDIQYTGKFHDYLWGAPKFVVKTDNNPLTYVLTTAKLDATGHRWLAALAACDVSIEYVPGSANRDADGLSRMPFETMDIATVQATCHLISIPLAHCHMMDEEYEASSSFPQTETGSKYG
ncbi:Pol polyprotein [Plakobranchus ocellatus]|uniref:Pol polyprotein n=1 Tax=Plakobranchus ocellatus TaxID=259542 RepID=A0AAV4B8D9_9GAST|nr:Pol polyprotein [Plakobranchus ocellatus]